MGGLVIRMEAVGLDDLDTMLKAERAAMLQAATTTLTTLARNARRTGKAEVKSAMRLPSRTVDKRLKVYRANPQTLQSYVFIGAKPVPLISLGARQVGHPGRPRTSNKKAARAARKRRRAKGVKPSRRGGVMAGGRGYKGAWIGKRADGSGGNQVFYRQTKQSLGVHTVDMAPAVEIIERHVAREQKKWPTAYANKLAEIRSRKGLK